MNEMSVNCCNYLSSSLSLVSLSADVYLSVSQAGQVDTGTAVYLTCNTALSVARRLRTNIPNPHQDTNNSYTRECITEAHVTK